MSEEKVRFKSGGQELVGIQSFPDKTPAPGVILFHGLSNTKEDCPLICETESKLQKKGFATFKFDFFGSGESPGKLKDKTIDILEQNARDALEYFYDDKISKIGLWGRSFGGTMVALLTPDNRIKSSVIATGFIIIEELFEEKWKDLKKKEKKLEKKGEKLPGTGNYKGEYEFEKEWFDSLVGIDKKISNRLKEIDSVLVLATTPDEKIPLENSAKIINLANEPKKIHIFEGVGHDYSGVEEQAVNYAVSWFKKYLTD